MNHSETGVGIDPIVGGVRAIARGRGLNGWNNRRPFGATLATIDELLAARDLALEFRLRQQRRLTDAEQGLADRVAESIVAASRGVGASTEVARA